MATGYELTQEEYDLFMEGAQLKMEELGLPATTESFLAVIKDWGKILMDVETVRQYVEAANAQKREALKAALEKQLEELG